VEIFNGINGIKNGFLDSQGGFNQEENCSNILAKYRDWYAPLGMTEHKNIHHILRTSKSFVKNCTPR
jgi:hypothetical protein